MVQRTHPHFSSSKIRRVYEKEGFALYVNPTKNRAETLSNPAYIPMKKTWNGEQTIHDSLGKWPPR